MLYAIEHQQILACGACVYSTSIQENQPISRIKLESAPSIDLQQSFENFLKNCLERSNYIIAHGKDFDRFALSLFQREPFDTLATHPGWLFTYGDFQLFPAQYSGKRDLLSLALYYGVGISSAHRAIYDCLLIAEVFNRVDHLKAAFTFASLPVIEAICSKNDSSPNELGFVWNHAKQGWFRKSDNACELPFSVVPEKESDLLA